MNRRFYIFALLVSFCIIGLLSGCTSSKGAADAPAEEVEKKEYLTGVVHTKNEGVKEFDCSHKIMGCREDESGGEMILNCLAGDPMGNLVITGGVTDYTLEKELC